MKLKIEEHRSPVINVDTLEVNNSAIQMYLKCAKQYEFRYVEGIKSRPGIALLEGSSHHKALEINNKNKRDKSKDLSPSALTEIFVEDFRDRVKKEKNEIIWQDEKEDDIISRADLLHRDYIRRIAPKIKPVDVEHKFEVPVKVGDLTFTLYGTKDLTTQSHVWDYKTTTRKRSQNDVDNDLQLTLYSFAAKKKKVGIIEFRKTANPEVGIIESERTVRQTLWALEIAASVVKAVRNKSFPMTNPTNWWCSPKWCGYWSRCRGKFEDKIG